MCVTLIMPDQIFFYFKKFKFCFKIIKKLKIAIIKITIFTKISAIFKFENKKIIAIFSKFYI